MPNDIVSILTMSSLEIAELTGKRHDHVLRDIEQMLESLAPNLGAAIESTTYNDANGNARKKYDLPKRECLVLVSGYSVKLRAKIIDRWLELEATQTMPVIHDAEAAALVKAVILADQARYEAAQAKREAVEAKRRAEEAHQRLDQIETAIDHFTVVGYAKKYLRRSLTQAEASKYGKKASKLCKEMDITRGTLPHPMHGSVYTYPKSVLDKIFSH